jgi:hypothetical protein
MKRVGIASAFYKANPVCLPEHWRRPCHYAIAVAVNSGTFATGRRGAPPNRVWHPGLGFRLVRTFLYRNKRRRRMRKVGDSGKNRTNGIPISSPGA